MRVGASASDSIARSPLRRDHGGVADERADVTGDPATGREILTWQLFGTASRELAQAIADDGFEPTLLLTIARGGLLPAGALGYALDLKNVISMNVEFYTGVDERLDMPVMLPPIPAAIDLTGAKVLIVDDVADTGETLKLVRDFCADHVAEARCAVIYEKPRSIVKCDYVWRRTEAWINFPWSSEPRVTPKGQLDL
jgi:uncharacterized protein